MWITRNFPQEVERLCGQFGLPSPSNISIVQDGQIELDKLRNEEKYVIICDSNTEEVARFALSETSQSRAEFITLEPDSLRGPPKVLPTVQNSSLVEGIIRQKDLRYVWCAGSGTLNDICKYAAFSAGVDYGVIATAPSMNGYISSNASIIQIDGMKTSFGAPAPRDVVLHLKTLCEAPTRLLNSGLADCLSKLTAQADWMLSRQLKGTRYIREVFDILRDSERYLLKNYNVSSIGREGFKNDLAMALTANLILSGVGMYIAKGSFPASGGEHAIAHYLEKNYPESMSWFYHGEHVAVSTLTMMAVQREMAESIDFNLPYSIGEVELSDLYAGLGIPVKPEDLRLTRESYDNAVRNAHKIRERFGFLNLYNE